VLNLVVARGLTLLGAPWLCGAVFRSFAVNRDPQRNVLRGAFAPDLETPENDFDKEMMSIRNSEVI
jgi:hypothetical protein